MDSLVGFLEVFFSFLGGLFGFAELKGDEVVGGGVGLEGSLGGGEEKGGLF